jgi:DNA-binding NarL/FixJ family response regulator
VVLTERERQIFGLLAHGLTGREIAAQLFLSPATVRTHVQNAMHKLGARTRAQAMALAAAEEPGARAA